MGPIVRQLRNAGENKPRIHVVIGSELRRSCIGTMETFAMTVLRLPIKGQNAIADLAGNAVPLSNLFTKVVDSTQAVFIPYISASEIEWYWS